MNNFLLDTNVIVDAFTADILHCLKCNGFNVSLVVFKEEVNKQIPSLCATQLNLINESYEELINAEKFRENNKRISFYDALNLSIAKNRNMILATGDQQLIKVANKQNVTCVGTLKIIEIIVAKHLISVYEVIESLKKLKQDSKRRIPINLIDSLIEQMQCKLETTR